MSQDKRRAFTRGEYVEGKGATSSGRDGVFTAPDLFVRAHSDMHDIERGNATNRLRQGLACGLAEKMMKTIGVVLAAVLAVACTSVEPPRSLDDYGGPERLGVSTYVRAAMAAKDHARVDDVEGPVRADAIQVITGPYWVRVFVGNPTSDPVFEIVDARVVETVAGGGFAVRATYKISGVLHFGGRSFPIHAEGSRASAASHMKAVNEAVQLGIIDAAERVKRTIELELAR